MVIIKRLVEASKGKVNNLPFPFADSPYPGRGGQCWVSQIVLINNK